jgi:trimeric autotransporter adhesin
MKKDRLCGLLLAALVFAGSNASGQGVGIGTIDPNASSQLDVSSDKRGILIPRMITSGVAAIANPAKGLMVYDSIRNQLMVNMGTPAKPNWQNIVAGSGWSLTGNSGTNPAGQFIGTTDGADLRFRVRGQSSGEIDSSQENAFFGYQSGMLLSGVFNSGFGHFSLRANTTGNANTAIGDNTLSGNITGSENVAVGADALVTGTSGFDNIAVGGAAMETMNGMSNIAVGGNTMFASTGGTGNIAIGRDALFSTTNSSFNTIVGYNSMTARNMGFNNTVIGANINRGVIDDGLFNIVAVGQDVPISGSNIARFGNLATRSIGGFADWTNFSDGRYKKDLKEDVAGIDFIMRLRPVTYRLDIAAIQNKLSEGSRQAAAKTASDRGHGANAEQLSKIPDAMNAAMQQAISEKQNTVFSGFAAQEVEKAANDAGYIFSGVDKPDNENGFYGLRYADFVVPLVKAVQEQQQHIAKLEKEIAELKKTIRK